MPEIMLSDGLPCQVRQAGLVELDEIGAGDLPDYLFYYEMVMAGGQKVFMPYDLDTLKRIPAEPTNDNPQPNTREWYELVEWQTYQAALSHREQWIAKWENHKRAIAGHILETCIDSADRQRIITADDLRAVLAAAIVPQITMEVIEATLASVFQGEMERHAVTLSLF